VVTFAATTTADRVDASDRRPSVGEAVEQANARAGADTIGFGQAIEGKTLIPTGDGSRRQAPPG
jgi:hypothetical protein